MKNAEYKAVLFQKLYVKSPVYKEYTYTKLV